MSSLGLNKNSDSIWHVDLFFSMLWLVQEVLQCIEMNLKIGNLIWFCDNGLPR